MLSRIVRLLTASAMVLAVAGCDGDEPPAAHAHGDEFTDGVADHLADRACVPGGVLRGGARRVRGGGRRLRALRQPQRADIRRGQGHSRGPGLLSAEDGRLAVVLGSASQLEADGIRIRGARPRPSVFVLSRCGPVMEAARRGPAPRVQCLERREGRCRTDTPVPQPTPEPTVIARARWCSFRARTWWRILFGKTRVAVLIGSHRPSSLVAFWCARGGHGSPRMPAETVLPGRRRHRWAVQAGVICVEATTQGRLPSRCPRSPALSRLRPSRGASGRAALRWIA